MLYVELPMLGCTTLSFYRPGVSDVFQFGMLCSYSVLHGRLINRNPHTVKDARACYILYSMGILVYSARLQDGMTAGQTDLEMFR